MAVQRLRVTFNRHFSQILEFQSNMDNRPVHTTTYHFDPYHLNTIKLL
jgi:hypothetical protein